MARVGQGSFGGGELSPALYSRVDLSKYQSGLRTCLNFVVKAQGGACNRSGFQYIGPAAAPGVRSRLIPFEFSTVQTYILEFGDQVIRVIKDGGYVLETATSITGLTQANPGVVTAAGHGLANGDMVFIDAVVGMTEANQDFYLVANKTTNTFELQDTGGSNVDSTAYTAYGSGGTVARVYSIATPYLEADLRDLGYTQSADTMTIAHPSYAPRDLTRTGHTAWTLTTITFATQATTPTGVAVVATGSGSTTYKYKVTSVDGDSEEQSLPSAEVSTTNDLDTAGNYNTVSWSAVTDAVEYNIYKDRNGIFGWIGVAGGTDFVDDNIIPDVTDAPPGNRNPFSTAGEYPGAVTYHEQRKVFGGSDDRPQTVWGTQIGRFKNMNVSRPTKADDAYTFTIASQQVNRVKHMVSLNNLIVFTTGAEFLFQAGSNGDAIGPTSIQVGPQSYRGASAVPPVVIGATILYVQNKQQSVRDFTYEFSSDAYAGNDLTILAKHLFETETIVEWAYAQEPNSVVWALRSDGVICSLTYLREHQVFAWARHVTDGAFESIASVGEGTEDAIYVVVKRTIDGNTRRYVERLHSRIFARVEDCFFVDSGLTLDQWNGDSASTVTASGGTTWLADDSVTLTENGTASPFVSADVGRFVDLRIIDTDGEITDRCRFEIDAFTSSTVVTATAVTAVPAGLQGVAATHWALAVTAISGLRHLEGATVSILADGNVEPQQAVTAGGLTFTRAVSKAHIGLQYTADLETLDLSGGPQGIGNLGRKVSVSTVDIIVHETRGLFAGPDADHLREYKQREFEAWGEPTALLTGEAEITITPSWKTSGRVLVRQTDPLPITVQAIIPDVDTED